MPYSAIIVEAPAADKNKYEDPEQDYAERDFGTLSSKRDIFVKSFLSKLKNAVEEEAERVNTCKEKICSLLESLAEINHSKGRLHACYSFGSGPFKI